MKIWRAVARMALAEWLTERDVEEVVMESTAQYWRPVWDALEQHNRRATAGRRPGRCPARCILAQAQPRR
jgi:hypothetical protein